ncbi:MAG TPA: WYL domain-containing protein [Acidimicrobiales bacterium]|nr:WYL domain-containing protein [Acidimicrobiales bacterium]
MRADRLVAILNLLQVRGQVTATEVAEELEISERTARRDLAALGQAGVPIYSLQGRNGGWRLAGGGKTDLSGLTAEEARALFLVAGPSSAASPAVRAAVRKLVRALPEPFRAAADATTDRVLFDRALDGDAPRLARTPPLLDEAQRCVVEGRQVALDYVARDGSATTRVIDPLGLASKGAHWYLVANTAHGLRTFRVDRVQSLRDTGKPAVRPDGFELADAWQLITNRLEDMRTPIVVTASLDPGTLDVARYMFGTRLRIGPPATDGRVHVEIRGHHVSSLAGELAGLGGGIEVHTPPDVRAALAEKARQLLALYG